MIYLYFNILEGFVGQSHFFQAKDSAIGNCAGLNDFFVFTHNIVNVQDSFLQKFKGFCQRKCRLSFSVEGKGG